MFRTSRACALVLVAALCAGTARSDSHDGWFTVLGNPAEADADTVQVDPAPVEVRGEQRVLRVRVNRAVLRTNWENVPYRSYVARVLIDCRERRGRYQRIELFMRPLWQGGAHYTADYHRQPERPMAFRDTQPNPTQRIIRAACGS
jgi:hypothetical protein